MYTGIAFVFMACIHFEMKKQHITITDLTIVPQFCMVYLHNVVVFFTK